MSRRSSKPTIKVADAFVNCSDKRTVKCDLVSLDLRRRTATVCLQPALCLSFLLDPFLCTFQQAQDPDPTGICRAENFSETLQKLRLTYRGLFASQLI